MKIQMVRIFVLALALGASACGAVHTTDATAENRAPSFRFAAYGTAPQALIAPDRGAVDAVAERAGRIVSRAPSDAGPRPPRPAEASSLPLLHASPEGRRFLSRPAGGTAGSRAFALGEPERSCPARVEAGGTGPAEAAAAALDACFAALDAAHAPPAGAPCGCRLVALNDAALAPAESFDYAPGVSARLTSADLDIDVDLSASEAEGTDGSRVLALYPSPGTPALIRVEPDGRARMLLHGREWSGSRTVEGLSRGRYRERIALVRDDGVRAILAIGWDPVAYAAERRRLTRWTGA
ncbi:hypothetical protein P2H44_06250 [Albimonas sp. CAU 1670]|uniref:hypothetical protein n=1 Tax=Albimonas sp. CAU 1670 TaxID=3032599 RepID=UPI0023DC662D|nr:hypothetical protein [Albimonas sp. CAU 1670]MDF2232150.1 hypothetical protein [Albimonas sp. CAU 1670]